MAKAKQTVKSFLEMMEEIDENSWEAFLSREEERLNKKFFPIAKNLGEESRLISYLNHLCKNAASRPKFPNAFKFFETWKRVSGYMAFEGRAGAMVGVRASMPHVNEGVEIFLKHFGITYTSTMTQEAWNEDELYHHRKVFGTTNSTNSDDIPF